MALLHLRRFTACQPPPKRLHKRRQTRKMLMEMLIMRLSWISAMNWFPTDHYLLRSYNAALRPWIVFIGSTITSRSTYPYYTNLMKRCAERVIRRTNDLFVLPGYPNQRDKNLDTKPRYRDTQSYSCITLLDLINISSKSEGISPCRHAAANFPELTTIPISSTSGTGICSKNTYFYVRQDGTSAWCQLAHPNFCLCKLQARNKLSFSPDRAWECDENCPKSLHWKPLYIP